ncbi:outer membrane protein assembly factor BamB family protein [Halostreptopolyspora alba]|uniref:outer membrane protein assembly factor BamB family protein n=1 Tax=Halostreptopolyspora alba TaxID=2487137 RepID=UPI0026844ED5
MSTRADSPRAGVNPGGCRRRTIGCVLVPAAVVLAVILVIATVSALRSGRIVPFPELRGESLWASEGLPGDTRGGWDTGETLVYGSDGGLVAFSPEDGDERWRMEPDSPVCAMSEDTAGDVGVLLLEGNTAREDVPTPAPEDDPDVTPEAAAEDEARSDDEDEASGMSCDVAVAVDTTTGQELWRSDPLAQTDLDTVDAYLLFSRGSQIEPVGEHVVVRLGGRMVALDHDGEEVWRDDGVGAPDTDCPATDLLPRDDSSVVLAGDCGIDEPVTVRVVDVAAGESATAFEFDRGESQPNKDRVAGTSLVAADPIHVRVDFGHADPPPRGGELLGEPEGGSLWVRTIGFDDDGSVRHALPLHGETPSVVENGRIYSTTDNSCANEVRAYDLATGEREWATEIRDMNPRVMDVDDGRLLVTREGLRWDCALFKPDRDAQYSAVDIDTGQEEIISPQVGTGFIGDFTAWWRDGRVYVLREHIHDVAGGIAAVE